jgi:hypothetical protein
MGGPLGEFAKNFVFIFKGMFVHILKKIILFGAKQHETGPGTK